MLNPPDPQPRIPSEAVLMGQCLSCRAEVRVQGWQCRQPRSPGSTLMDADPFADLPSTGCPHCGARVYLEQQRTP